MEKKPHFEGRGFFHPTKHRTRQQESMALYLQHVQICACAPFAVNDINVKVEPLHLVDPQQAELANAEGDDLVTRGKSVGKSALPPTSPCAIGKVQN